MSEYLLELRQVADELDEEARHFGSILPTETCDEAKTCRWAADEIERLRAALLRAGNEINSVRDEWSERDTTQDPLPHYIAEALKP